jgi:hypothetical protein
MPRVAMLSFVGLNVAMLSVVILSSDEFRVLMRSVVMLSVVASILNKNFFCRFSKNPSNLFFLG